MSDSWDNMRKAKEEQFFQKQNEEAMSRLKAREADKPRLSPITGKPMVQVTMMGVNIDKCEDSGGVWLDAGELEALIEASKTTGDSNDGKDWFARTLGNILGKKS